MKGILPIVASLLLAGCAGKVPAWSYAGADGPAFWGDLSPAWVAAKTGREQSPVDISDPQPATLAPIATAYVPTPLEIENDGHMVIVHTESGGALELDGVRYALKQIHFHSPSEHTVDGEHADLEMQLVHADEDGNTLVLGVFLEVGIHNEAFTPLWWNLPKEPGPAKTIPDVTIDAAALLPGTLAGFRYDGSLTAPPCTEGVTWIVLQDVVQLSPGQVQTFQLIFNGNNRPVQPLHGRVVTMDEP